MSKLREEILKRDTIIFGFDDTLFLTMDIHRKAYSVSFMEMVKKRQPHLIRTNKDVVIDIHKAFNSFFKTTGDYQTTVRLTVDFVSERVDHDRSPIDNPLLLFTLSDFYMGIRWEKNLFYFDAIEETDITTLENGKCTFLLEILQNTKKKVGIISNSTYGNIFNLFNHSQVSYNRMFDFILCKSESLLRKPDPEFSDMLPQSLLENALYIGNGERDSLFAENSDLNYIDVSEFNEDDVKLLTKENMFI
jgi:FMN phosphatase YigB (HAD superfamily)